MSSALRWSTIRVVTPTLRVQETVLKVVQSLGASICMRNRYSEHVLVMLHNICLLPTLHATALIPERDTKNTLVHLFYLFGVLHRFQHCTGHITMGSWKGRGNQYIEFVRVLYCKLLTNGKELPAFPLEAVPGIEPRPQRWEARVLPLCHRGPLIH